MEYAVYVRLIYCARLLAGLYNRVICIRPFLRVEPELLQVRMRQGKGRTRLTREKRETPFQGASGCNLHQLVEWHASLRREVCRPGPALLNIYRFHTSLKPRVGRGSGALGKRGAASEGGGRRGARGVAKLFGAPFGRRFFLPTIEHVSTRRQSAVTTAPPNLHHVIVILLYVSIISICVRLAHSERRDGLAP
jgi:hypothetical protein